MLNRCAVVVKSKQPFVDWVNTSDPYNDDPRITLAFANEESTVYLIDDKYADNFETWVKRNFKAIFEYELNDWYTDPSLWPEKRDLRTFRKWFDVESHSMIVDTGKGAIFDDENELGY